MQHLGDGVAPLPSVGAEARGQLDERQPAVVVHVELGHDVVDRRVGVRDVDGQQGLLELRQVGLGAGVAVRQRHLLADPAEEVLHALLRLVHVEAQREEDR